MTSESPFDVYNSVLIEKGCRILGYTKAGVDIDPQASGIRDGACSASAFEARSMGFFTRDEVESAHAVFLQMSEFVTGVSVFVNRPRIEDGFVQHGKVGVGGKDSVGADEVH